MNILIEKLHEDVIVPTVQTLYSSGADIRGYFPDYDNQEIVIDPGQSVMVPTGFKIQPPEGFDIKLYPRSSIAYKLGATLANCVGIIDRDFDHEVKVLLHNQNMNGQIVIHHNERIAQLLLERIEPIKFEVVDKLPKLESNRDGGFGSTGKD